MDLFANILYALQTTICIEDGPTMNLIWASVERPFEHWMDNSVHEVAIEEVYDCVIVLRLFVKF